MSEASSPHRINHTQENSEPDSASKLSGNQALSPSLRPRHTVTELNRPQAFVTSAAVSTKRGGLLDDSKLGIDNEVYTIHDRIHGLVDNLDLKIKGLLNENQNSFLIAYKEQMMHVQKELKNLKKKIEEETHQRRHDERLKILEQERDWFKNEALRLDKICDEQQRIIKETKFKMNVLLEDKNFFEKTALNEKKENKTLRERIAALEGIELPIGEYTMGSSVISRFGSPGGNVESQGQGKRRIGTSTGKKRERSIDEKESEFKLDKREFFSDLNAVTGSNDSKMVEIIKQLKMDLDKEKKISKTLRSEKSQMLAQRIELEEILIESINEVKKDIVKRKSVKNYKDIERNIQNAPKADISKFLASDKRNVVEYFLSHDLVLSELYNLVFNSLNKTTPARPIQTAYEKVKPSTISIQAEGNPFNSTTRSDQKGKFTFNYGFTSISNIRMTPKEIENVQVSNKAQGLFGELRSLNMRNRNIKNI